MPSDLDYFRESDLNKECFKTFYHGLPSEDLKKQFLNSMPKNDLCWSSGWVLQGYKGPYPNGDSGDSQKLSPNCGLQEVRYWWGLSKHLNWVPIAGSIVWGMAKIVHSMTDVSKWCSLYFDSKTGECLSHDKDVAASKLNDKGDQLFNSGKYEEAKEYFSNAIAHSNKKANQDAYKANRDKVQAKINFQGNSQSNNFFEQGDRGNSEKAEYNIVLTNFGLMLSQDVSENELKEFSDRLETLLKRGHKSDPEIVNRSIITNLRIARMKMNDQMKSINPENMSDIGIIMNSIETEIGVIKKLKKTDQK
jgi:hypothetical protein